MNGAAENQFVSEGTARELPLDAAHRSAGASMREQDGWLVPAHYADASAEYEAVRGRHSAGLIDLSLRGRIEVSGSEAVRFLNGLVTNDVAKLEDGAWMHAAFPNAQGRLLASVRVLRRGERFLFDTEAATHARLHQTLERFTLAGDFHVHDLTTQTAALSVQGSEAAHILRAALGATAGEVKPACAVEVEFESASVNIMRATHTQEDGFDIFCEAGVAERLWRSLVAAGARPVGFDALEVLRIEAGVPRYGVDVSEANVVLEAVREQDAVSYTKGCYIGQEIIARIHWRGHVAKRLTGIVIAREVTAPTSHTVKSCGDGREVGRITSSVFSPRLRRHVALGIIRYEYLKPGTEVKIFAGEEELCAAQVADLPLVRGSWAEVAGGA